MATRSPTTCGATPTVTRGSDDGAAPKVQGGDGGWLPGCVDFDLGCPTILLGQ